jgi:FG-GAP repeat
MFRRIFCLLVSILGVALLALPGAASAQDLQGYKVKLVGYPGWPNDQAGNSVAIGDVNGDGVPDYVIGDTMAGPNGRPQSGSVYVVYGKASDKTTPRTVDLAQIPQAGQGSSPLGYRIDGWSAYDHFGASVAVGDLNSDGVGDVVVGDPDASPYGRTHAGNVYVIYGQQATSTPEIDVSNMTAGQGTVITGWAAGDRTGQSVAVGRFNSDSPYGCNRASTEPSLAVGAPGGSPNGQGQAGEVYDLYGSDFLFQPGALDLNNLSPAKGYLIQGHWAGDQLGQSVADGGDVNHNCSNAILAGDPQAGPNGMPQSGTVYVIYGKPRTFSSTNEDVSTLEQNGQGYRINGPASNAHYGASVANAGAVDGNPIPDVIAGAPDYNSGAGEAIVTYGQSGSHAGDINTSNLSPSSGYAIQGFTKDQTLNGDGKLGSPIYACSWFHQWTYGGSLYPNGTSVTAEGDRAGTTVAGLGDVNGDGLPDVLVGAPGWNDSAGAVAVLYGHRFRTQGNVSLSGLPSSQGTVISDSNTPAPETEHPYGGLANDGASWLVKPQSQQIQEQTQEAVSNNGQWDFCSNYMAERGDQAGSALGSTASGTGGFAVVGAPTHGQTNYLAWHGWPGNPTVWFSDGNTFGQLGLYAGGQSGEADWAEIDGSGAAYILGF